MAEQKPTLCVVAGPNGSGKTTTELLLANDFKQISDCTGGRRAMQFDTASRNINR